MVETGNTETALFYKIYTMNNTTGTTIGASTPAYAYVDLWCLNGIPSCGDIPSTAATICTSSTTGALKQTNPAVGKEKFLLQAHSYSASKNGYLIYDRLIHNGGLFFGTTTVQSINLTGITRYSGASSSVGNRIMFTIYSGWTGGASSIYTINYTNQDGIANRQTYIFLGAGGAREIGRAIIAPLASGDTGVLSVQSISGSTSATVDGNFGVSIIRPIYFTYAPYNSGGIQYKDFMNGLPGLFKIENDACISALLLRTSTSTISENIAVFTMSFIEK